MLCCDRMGAPNENDKSLECFNSPYQIIMLRSINSTSIVGILKPDDSENFKLQDEHELIYRQYSSKTTNFEGEMAVAICDKTRFNYHPYLSDLNAIIIKEETNGSTPE